jgi:hypothetical protein
VESTKSYESKKQKMKTNGRAGGNKNGKPQHAYCQMSEEQKKKLQTEKKCSYARSQGTLPEMPYGG